VLDGFLAPKFPFEDRMSRLSLLPLLLVFAAPVFAKPYPLPCKDLWSAVTDTLSNPGNYKIIGTDDEQMKASFIVVGALYPGMNAVFLRPKDNGCELQIKMSFTGNDDEGALRSRVNHTIAKRKAAKPVPPAPTAGAGE
jgi:hypothetical protein